MKQGTRSSTSEGPLSSKSESQALSYSRGRSGQTSFELSRQTNCHHRLETLIIHKGKARVPWRTPSIKRVTIHRMYFLRFNFLYFSSYIESIVYSCSIFCVFPRLSSDGVLRSFGVYSSIHDLMYTWHFIGINVLRGRLLWGQSLFQSLCKV